MTLTQLDFFGNNRAFEENHGTLLFWLKKHEAQKAGLHYDLRFQFVEFQGNRIIRSNAKSFALRSAPSFDPDNKVSCVLVDDHKINALRREGTILEGTGTGCLIHLDEGEYSISGCNNLKDLGRAFKTGMEEGQLLLSLTGHRIKGNFYLKRSRRKKPDWILQKAEDEYASKESAINTDTSILSGLPLEYYRSLFQEQQRMMQEMNAKEIKALMAENNKESFNRYKNLALEQLITL